VLTFLLRSKLAALAALPEFVQLTSVAVVVQTNCAEAGAFAASKNKVAVKRDAGALS
jgi:hypothetical protein